MICCPRLVASQYFLLPTFLVFQWLVSPVTWILTSTPDCRLLSGGDFQSHRLFNLICVLSVGRFKSQIAHRFQHLPCARGSFFFYAPISASLAAPGVEAYLLHPCDGKRPISKRPISKSHLQLFFPCSLITSEGD